MDDIVPDTVKGLQILLALRLDRHKPHTRTHRGLGNGLCIDAIVLIALHERLHKLTGDEPNLITVGLEQPTSMMRRGAYLHGNHCTRFDAFSYGLDPVVSLASATENNRPTLINRMEVEDVLGVINTDNSNGHGSAPHQRPASYLRDRVGEVHPIAYDRTR
nr:hypothetical protein [Spiribacter sp. SSL99]